MGGRRRLPAGLGSDKQEAVRLTFEQRIDFTTACYMLNRYKSEVLREAVHDVIEQAKRIDPKRFQHLRKTFAEGNTPS